MRDKAKYNNSNNFYLYSNLQLVKTFNICCFIQYRNFVINKVDSIILIFKQEVT